MIRTYDRKLIIEDGSQYYGYGFGADTDNWCSIQASLGIRKFSLTRLIPIRVL